VTYSKHEKIRRFLVKIVFCTLLTAFICGVSFADEGAALSANNIPDRHAIERGRGNWFNKTYGGGKFFQFLANHPDPSKRISLGFDKVILTPRHQRFQTWGTINDPDCRANPNGGPDLCKDPEATGIIGIRQSLGSGGKIYGVSCASCHAGFDPVRPPQDPNEPKWFNIHPTIGNQYLDSAKIFSANLAATDVRRLMFLGWPKGTVDTTLLFNDGIMNPGTITAFWNMPQRPLFDVAMEKPKNRGGQGGEDDVGADLAALRVYTNIGVCFAECVAARPGQPIDIAQCRQACPDFPPKNEIDDMVTFMRSVRAPQYPWFEKKPLLYARGERVFEKNCATCHGGNGQILSNDEVNPLAKDSANATNKCRVLTTNWETGRLWSQFSSQLYKDRVNAGNRGYRTMPLAGIWATAPFLHNQSIGAWAPAKASAKERGHFYEQAMAELLSANRTPKINVAPVAVGPFPPGTPLTQIFSRDAAGNLLCDDVIENRGHYYGSDLRDHEKRALIHWLKFQ
jgi:mono/diheme cytochrome c family protein